MATRPCGNLHLVRDTSPTPPKTRELAGDVARNEAVEHHGVVEARSGVDHAQNLELRTLAIVDGANVQTNAIVEIYGNLRMRRALTRRSATTNANRASPQTSVLQSIRRRSTKPQHPHEN